MPSTVRFLHLADLHLRRCRRDGRCGPEDQPCDACIKRALLERLGKRIEAGRPRYNLLLLAGDLTERRAEPDDVEVAARPLTQLVETAVACGVEVVGVTGEHDGEDSTAVLRDRLGWSWLLDTGAIHDRVGVAVYGVGGRPKRRRVAHDIGRIRVDRNRPRILLAHGDWGDLPRAAPSPFNYYAMGHRHVGMVVPHRTREPTLVGYPGHLFSCWDGDGKPWPVHFIEGTIDAEGAVRAELVDSATALGAPQTRRLYVPFGQPLEGGTLSFENSPSLCELCARGLRPAKVDDATHRVFLRETPRIYRNKAHFVFDSAAAMEDIARGILSAYPDDVFVTPAPRMVAYGRNIKGDILKRFLKQTIKATATTQ